MAEFLTVQFPNTAAGQLAKTRKLAELDAEGWRVVSENIDAQEVEMVGTCCLMVACPPCSFVVGPEKFGTINVTLRRDVGLIRCPDCGKDISSAALSCPQCGRPMPPATSSPAASVEPPHGRAPTGPSASTFFSSSATTRRAPASLRAIGTVCGMSSSMATLGASLETFVNSLERRWRALPLRERKRLGAIAALVVFGGLIVAGVTSELSNRTDTAGLRGSAEAPAPKQLSEDAQRRQFILDLQAKLVGIHVSDDIAVEARGGDSRTIRYRIGTADFRAGMPDPRYGVGLLVGRGGLMDKATLQALGFRTIEFEDGKGVVTRYRIAGIVPR